MRDFLILLLSVLLTTIALADEFIVKSFEYDQSDISARVNSKRDVNGEYCAIIKVRTGLKNLKFHSNQLSDLEQKTGEYWLYVSPVHATDLAEPWGELMFFVRFEIDMMLID